MSKPHIAPEIRKKRIASQAKRRQLWSDRFMIPDANGHLHYASRESLEAYAAELQASKLERALAEKAMAAQR